MEKLPQWIKWAYLALFALLPWSLECSFGTWKINLPTEPLIATLGVGLAWFIFKNPGTIRALFSNNFLLKISAAWIGWLAISACFSTMSLVSWKYWVVEAGHWWAFAAGLAVFPSVWPKALRIFAFAMAGVVVFTLIHHSFYDFRADQALLAPMPFFPENTLYAAVLAMLLFSMQGVWEQGETVKKGLTLVLIAGLVFSFCRAAWLSVLVAGFVGSLLIFRKKWRLIAFSGLVLLACGMVWQEWIFEKIKSDVSSLERLNRFAAALRMTQERPVTGFGPGTFQFQYLPFQKPEQMTRISAREPVLERSPLTYGRGGGAHSEFFQALAEAGCPGLLLWIILMATALWKGFYLVFFEKNTKSQRMALALALSLLTFFIHSFANNMLHDGRIAALFWGTLVAIGSRSRRRE